MKHTDDIATVARGLGELVQRVAFVGGAVIGLYIDDPGAPRPRFTDDVDCVVEVSGYGDYALLETRLRELNFTPDTSEHAPLCRWIFRGVRVDVMPTEPKILGFSNRWYGEAMRHCRELRVAEVLIRGFTIPYLIATKLEAFRDRGQGDWFASHDLEDIIALCDGARSTFEELAATTGAIRDYLVAELGSLVRHSDAYEIVLGHVRPGALAATSALRVIGGLQSFVR